MLDSFTMIIEDSANTFWAVRDLADVNLSHVWLGIPVKRSAGGFAAKAKARPILIRKECTVVRAMLGSPA